LTPQGKKGKDAPPGLCLKKLKSERGKKKRKTKNIALVMPGSRRKKKKKRPATESGCERWEGKKGRPHRRGEDEKGWSTPS